MIRQPSSEFQGVLCMLFGAIGFSYGNFAHTRKVFESKGKHSANLGDNMQSLAVRHLYGQLGIAADQIVRIDRDHLPSYDGPPVVLPMNAVFHRSVLPASDKIIPIFIGFHAKHDTILAHRDWLGRHAPIGCRDPDTAAALTDLGIAAHVTGCLTCCLPPRNSARAPVGARDKVILVQGAGTGAFPKAALSAMPEHLRKDLIVIKQRKDMTRLPLTAQDMDGNDQLAQALLARYCAEARLIVTALHHAAAPCMAAGIPVVLARDEIDKRFGFLQTLLPIYTGPSFEDINWNPAQVALGPVQARQSAAFKAALAQWL
jgi:hypothetical protein